MLEGALVFVPECTVDGFSERMCEDVKELYLLSLLPK
jgi:hypothetical protein